MTDVEHGEGITWSPLIGFEDDLVRLQKLYEAGSLPQVLLFLGREGIGKSIFLARLLAGLYCEGGLGCGDCGPCQELLDGSFRELLWLDPASKFKTEHVRQVQEHFSLSAGRGFGESSQRPAARIAVMIDVDRCTDQAANQLLKTLEEPQGGMFVFMTSSKPRQILETILSRAVRWQLRPPPVELGLQWLKDKWSQDFSLEDLQQCYREVGYSIGKADGRLSQQSAEGPDKVDDALNTLLFSQDAGQSIEAAATLTRQLQLNAVDIILRIELLLNRYYRWRLGVSSEGAYAGKSEGVYKGIDASTLRRWRQNLAKFRAIAGRSQISLNAQMVAESFALSK